MKSVRPLPPLVMVDDDQNDAVLFARRLKDTGCPNPLVHFRNGGDVFMYLKQFCDGAKPAEQRPCLVFLDVNMPSLSGFDVLAWARQQSALRGMKIIMLSGATEPWDSKIAAKLGADDYLVKFPPADKLSEILRTHLHFTPKAGTDSRKAAASSEKANVGVSHAEHQTGDVGR